MVVIHGVARGTSGELTSFRVDIRPNGAGSGDYRLRTAEGYDSGIQLLERGPVKLRR